MKFLQGVQAIWNITVSLVTQRQSTSTHRPRNQHEQISIPVGCVPRFLAPRRVVPGGMVLGEYDRIGYGPGRVEGVGVTVPPPPPVVDRMTHACVNIRDV